MSSKTVKSLYMLGEYEKVLYFYYNENNNPSIFTQNIVAAIYYQAEWYEISKEMYETLFHLTDDVQFLFRYSSSLFRLGNTEGCLNTLRMAEIKVLDNANIEDLDLLSLAYLEAMQYEKALDYAFKTFKYGEKNPEVWISYFWRYIQIIQFVDNPKKEYTDAYQKIFSTFHKTFPDVKEPFEQFRAIENGRISNDFLDKLKNLESSQKEIQKLYKKNKLPLQILCELTKNQPFLTWGHVANQGELYFWVNEYGSISEVREGMKNILNSKKNVLCDLFCIFTLDYLNLLDIFAKEFNIYIYQIQFNAFFSEYLQLKLSQNSGLKSISYENGRIIGYEWSPSQVQESLLKMNNIMSWINENCKKVGKSRIEPQNSQERVMFDDQLQLCKDSLFAFMIDNYIVKNFATKEHGVKCFTVYDFLNYILAKKIVSIEEYNQMLGKLIIIGYRFITAKKDTFLYYLKKNQFNIEAEVLWLFSYLKENQVNREYAYSIVLDILYWLSEENIEDTNKEEKLISLLCDLLLGQDKNRGYLEKLILKCEEIFAENKDYLRKIKEVIENKLSD